MLLSELGVIPQITEIRFTGKPQATNITASDGSPYFIWKLLKPITVRCSTDKEIEALETDELYLREDALSNPDWQGNEKDGFFIPNWKADFSKGQEVAIYQETTIREWARNNREDRNGKKKSDLNAMILGKMAQRAGK